MNILIDISVQCESFIYWCRSVFLSISHMCISTSEEEKTNIRMFGRGRSYGERKQEKVMNRCEYLSSSHTYTLSAFKIRTNVFPFFLALLNSLALQECSYLESSSGLFLPFLWRRMRSWFCASNRQCFPSFFRLSNSSFKGITKWGLKWLLWQQPQGQWNVSFASGQQISYITGRQSLHIKEKECPSLLPPN